MDFIDLGKKETSPVEAAKAESSKKIWYPSFHIRDKDLPVEEEDVGKEIIATVKLKIVSVEKSIRTGTGKIKKTENYSFDILGINFGKSKIDTQEIIEEELKGTEKK